MPTPQEAAAILRRFLAASAGSDIALPRDPTPLDSNRLPPSWQSDDDFERQVIANSAPARNPRRTDLTPLDTNRLPPSSQSDADFEQQVIAGSEPRRNPRTLPYPIFDPSNSLRREPAVQTNPLDTNRLPEASAGAPAEANSGRVALARLLGVDQGPPPDPAASAAILSSGAMRANDPQALARNRYTEAHDLESRIADNAAALAMPPSEGFVPGEPGRRYLTRGVTPANLVADKFRLGQLRSEAAADPFTGDAETARVGDITHALDAAAQVQRPEIGDAAKTIATRNAFADYMKSKGMKMGEYEAASSPAAQAAAMVPITANASDTAEGIKDKALQREQALRMSPQLVPGQMPDDGAGGLGGFTLPPNYKPLNAADSNAIESMAKAAPMVGDLERMLDPNANQITNKAAQTAKWGLYNIGVSPNLFGDKKAQARLQLSSLIKIVGSSPYMTGSRNYRYLQDVQKHLTDPSATDQFLLSQIAELKKRWPEMQKAIIQTHIQPGTPLDFGGGADPWAAPPSPEELGGPPMSMDELSGRADALTRRRR